MKKRNNIITKKGNYYYRLRWYNKFSRQIECTIPLMTKIKRIALQRGDIIKKDVDNIKDGTIQKFQFKERFPWMNDTGTSVLIDQTLENVIPDYLAYKESKQRASTVDRDRVSINQLCDFIGYSKPVQELSYQDIEGVNGLIQHLRSKGYKDNGINVTLRHLRTFFNWLYKKVKLINEPIEFDFLPKDEQEYYIDEYQIQAIHDYIDQGRINSFFKRALIFYEYTGVRAIEPFIGELYGDWLYIDPSKSKGKNLRKIQLSEDLKTILLEMHAFRDEYKDNGSPDPVERSYQRISKTLAKIVKALKFSSSRKITLKSFRHHYGIRRVFMTGNIFQVAMEMGHKNTTTTQHYLRFQPDELKQYFPSLIPIIEEMENMQKKSIRGTKMRGTIYPSVNKLST